MIEEAGYVPTIYDRPPHPWFHLVELLTDGDVTKHDATLDMPLTLALSYADKKLRTLMMRAQAHHNAPHNPEE